MSMNRNWSIRCCAFAYTLGFLMWMRPTADAASKGSLTGTLVDQDSKPIAGVRLLFLAEEERTIIPFLFAPPTHVSRANVKATTDKDGVFRAEFARSRMNLVGLEKSAYWIEPNQGFPNGWHPNPNYGNDRAIGEILAYHFPTDAELSVVKESAPVSHPLTGEQVLYYDWETNTLGPSAGTGPRLSFALRMFQESGFPLRARLTIRAVDAGLWAGGNELPYAPMDHYERGLMLFASPAYPLPVSSFLYVRTTTVPERYARIVVTYDWRRKVLTCSARYNPTGSRLLAAPRYVPEPPLGWLAPVINVRAEWWVGMERSYSRPTNCFAIFDPERAEATLRRLKLGPRSWQSFPLSTEQRALLELAGNPTCPPAVLEAIEQEHFRGVNRYLVANPAVPTNLLHTVVSTNREILKKIATDNLKLSPAHRQFLKGD